MSDLRAIDFPCPKCKAAKDDPCVNVKRTRYGPPGAPRSRPHDQRAALVPPKPESHGTYRGFQAHKRKGTEPCDPCRKANAAYMRRYRAEHPADYAHEKRLQAARSRAMTRLVHAYPDDFARLYAEEQSA